MSTILDALRKVEREREPTSGALEGPTVSPEVRRRRSFPVIPVLICAVVGFAGGALLSWWTPGEKPEEVAALPAPPAPPDIAVPRAPVRARVKPAAPPAPADVAKADVPPPPDVAVPPAAAPPPPAAVPPPAPPAAPVAPAPAANAAPVTAAPAGPGEAKPDNNVQIAALPHDAGAPGAADKGSALEPSPFGAPREAGRDNARPSAPANVAVKRPGADVPALSPASPAGQHDEDRDVAALVPSAPSEAPPAETNLEPAPEPEPEPPAESVFDTGRSPPGAPKVALSFLQWSADPARRFAFISVDGAPSQRVREGEVAAGLTVAAITPTGVQFKREGTTFVIRPRH